MNVPVLTSWWLYRPTPSLPTLVLMFMARRNNMGSTVFQVLDLFLTFCHTMRFVKIQTCYYTELLFTKLTTFITHETKISSLLKIITRILFSHKEDFKYLAPIKYLGFGGWLGLKGWFLVCTICCLTSSLWYLAFKCLFLIINWSSKILWWSVLKNHPC